MLHRIAAAILALVAFTATLAAAAPPAAQSAGNLLLNPGAELGKGDLPSVWFPAQVPSDGLRMYRATDVAHSGKASLAISNSHDYPETVCNNWAQDVQEVPIGKAVRVDAWLKTDDADSANVCVQCWDIEGKNMLAFATTPIFRGTEDWVSAHSDPVIVPEGTASIWVRASLAGKGKAWFDDVTFKVVPARTLSTGAATAGAPVEDGEAAQAPREIPPDLAQAAGGKVLRSIAIAKDLMILAYLPDWAFGTVDNVGIADNDGGVRALYAWGDIPAADAGNEKLEFILAVYSRGTTAGGKPAKIGAYEITDSWQERSSWKTQSPTASEPAMTYDFVGGNGWKLFNVTPLVQAQGDEAHRGYGVQLRFADETRSSQKHDWSGYAFVSREATGEWQKYRPMLLVVEPEAQRTPIESTAAR